MAVAAEAVYEEVYSRSLKRVRSLGRVAAQGAELDLGNGAVQEGWRDFVSAVEENLATDPEYGEQLLFEPFRSYRVIDGRVCDQTGEAVIDMVTRGYEASRQAALSNPEMAIQAERDEGDVLVAEAVDSLAVGELYAVASVEPKNALKRNPRYWRDELGYREGVAVLQVYYRSGSGELLAGAYSIKQSDMTALRAIFAGYGVHIPEDESENRFIRHGIRIRADREDAEEFGKHIVRAHRRAIGQAGRVLSVTELVQANQALVKSYFDGYLAPLARAYVLGRSDERVQKLALAMLGNSAPYTPTERHSMIRLANGLSPNEQDVRFMEEKIRYALVEELRRLVPAHLAGDRARYHGVAVSSGEPVALAPMHDMAARMAGNIAGGIAANRTYGGCQGAGRERQAESGTGELGLEQQDVFGGKTTEGSEKLVWKKGVCRISNCPTRPGQTDVAQCSVCRGCQHWFDRGRDPAKMYKGLGRAQKTAVTTLFGNAKKMTIERAAK